MPRRQIQRHEIQNPERILSHLIRDYIAGKLDDNRSLFRASVVAIDHVGGQFELDPPNPKNSVRARIFTNGMDATTDDEDLPIFWPLHSHVCEPVKENEHVLVMFEDERRENGMWVSRIAEPNNTDSTNYVLGVQKYLNRPENNLQSVADAQTQVQFLSDPPSPVSVSPEFVIENVPPFTQRVGDHVLHGSNNTIIVLGRDRPSDRQSGQTENAGTIDIVAGRTKPDDMDMQNDAARIYISAKTDADGNFGTGNVGNAQNAPGSAVVHVGDQVRIIARDGVKIVAQGNVVIEGANISIGNGATEPAVLGDQLKQFLTDLITSLASQQTCAVGPVQNAGVGQLQKDLATILSSTVTVKG